MLKRLRLSLVLLATILSVCISYGADTLKPVTASWYGKNFQGKLTASGVPYNMYAMTAAHKKLPFGTCIRVVNVKTKAEVVVQINDRGPFIEGRELDLSYAAAKQIGILGAGTGLVTIEILGREKRKYGERYNGCISSEKNKTTALHSVRAQTN